MEKHEVLLTSHKTALNNVKNVVKEIKTDLITDGRDGKRFIKRLEQFYLP